MQLYEAGVDESEATSECIALGRFREPPVFARFGRTNLKRNSRGGLAHAKAAPLQAMGDRISHERANPFEDEDENGRQSSLSGVVPPIANQPSLLLKCVFLRWSSYCRY